jgi:hypothetical protein
MLHPINFIFALSIASAALASRETVRDAALSARKLLRNESVLVLSSIFEHEVNPALTGQPIGYVFSQVISLIY